MPSIKKSELDGLKARVKSSYDFALEESRRASEERNLFRDREKVWRAHLWNTEQELRDLKELLSEAESRITERNQTVAKLLRINLAAELRREKENVRTVVRYVQWNPGTFYSTHEPGTLLEGEQKPKKSYARLAVSLLIGATIGLTILCAYEGHIIRSQRELILQMLRYIQTFCSF
jgi:hypothetical protein